MRVKHGSLVHKLDSRIFLALRKALAVFENFLKRAAHDGEIMRCGERDFLDAHSAVGGEVDDGRALPLTRLAERILHERACVADVRRPRLLRRVQMPERRVGKAREARWTHAVRAADGKRPLRIGRCAARDEGMGDGDAAAALGHERRRACDGERSRFVEAREFFRRLTVGEAHRRRLHVGQERKGDLAVRIIEDDGSGVRLQLPRDKNAAPCKEAAAKAETRSAVVVARDVEHLDLFVEQKARERIVEELDRLDGRHGAIVDVARDDDGLGACVSREMHKLVEEVRLIVRQMAAEEEPPEVPIGGMDEAHGKPSFHTKAARDGRKADLFVREEHAKPFRSGRLAQICAEQEEGERR